MKVANLGLALRFGLLAFGFDAAASNQAEMKFEARASENKMREVEIFFRSLKTFSRICELEVEELSLKNPSKNAPGKIVVRAELPEPAICARAYGQHFGSLTLELGDELPALRSGVYEIEINSAQAGVLEIH